MKKALISPLEAPVYYVSAWEGNPPEPILSPVIGSCRIVQVQDSAFEVAEPLFWTDCPDDCISNEWYYNTETKECLPLPNVPEPV